MQDCAAFFRKLQCMEEQGEAAEAGEERQSLQELGKLKNGILQRERMSEIFLPAPYLRECCMLTETEYWLMLFAFCCETEGALCLEFRRRYGGVRPTLQYALHMLSRVLSVDFMLVAAICGPGRSIWDILRLSDGSRREPPEGWENGGGILEQPLLLSRTAFYFLLTGGFLRQEWCDYYFGETEADPQRGFWQNDSGRSGRLRLHQEEYALLEEGIRKGEPLGILVNGRRGCGRHTLLKTLLYQENISGIRLKIPYLSETGAEKLMVIQKDIRLLCALTEPALIFDFGSMAPWDADRWEEMENRLEMLRKGKGGSGAVFFLTEDWDGPEPLRAYTDMQVDLKEYLSAEEKKHALDVFLSPEDRRPWQDELMERYRLNIGELRDQLKRISFLAKKAGACLGEELPWIQGARDKRVGSRLGRIIETAYTMEDMVVSRNVRKQLETVMELSKVWFNRRETGKGAGEGFQVLFHGDSGTGKTMAASVLASWLRLPLFKIDLSRIMDKYIGETEKHLDDIFWIARRENCVLFFDEADALFSKRRGIQDSRDRYANIQTAYLLQRMEAFDGIMILATNLIDHFDDAFLRRIRFVIRFGNLEEEDRALLWEGLLARESEGTLAEEVSPRKLAAAAELSPARIQAAVQTAGMLAAAENSRYLTNAHLQAALELEAGKDETFVARIMAFKPNVSQE